MSWAWSVRFFHSSQEPSKFFFHCGVYFHFLGHLTWVYDMSSLFLLFFFGGSRQSHKFSVAAHAVTGARATRAEASPGLKHATFLFILSSLPRSSKYFNLPSHIVKCTSQILAPDLERKAKTKIQSLISIYDFRI